jgi:cell division septation protein DedD
MSEEKIDGLEGLDDFGDDFGEQLDSFMENDGEDEGDSELDSFFEDLSTIDDLESDDHSESEEAKYDVNEDDHNHDDDDVQEEDHNLGDDDLDEDDADDVLEDEEIDDEEKQEQKSKRKAASKGFPLKAVILSCVSGLILGSITIAVLYYLATPSETQSPETVLEPPPKPAPVAKLSKPKPEKSKLRTKTKKYSYYIQVISCISHECVNESRLQLKSLGYKTRVRTSSESSGIAEVLSTNVLGEEESAKMVKEINSNNPLAGHAYRKLAKNGFRVSLGLFPELEAANRVRTYLNQAFKNQIFFKIQRTTQKILFQKVQIGGLKSKKEAEKLRNRLKQNNPDFRGAFVFLVKNKK